MGEKSPIQQYADLMRETKRRVDVVDYFLFRGGHALYRPTTIESACLQIRKILELIAFSSLSANKTAYSAVHADFEKHWNAKFLLRDLARVNPNFYPKPHKEIPSARMGVKSELKDVKTGFLTQDDFVKVYVKCGAMMHAGNPYGSRASYEYFQKMLPTWRAQIVALLNSHTVKVLGHPGFWLIHMKEEGDDEVHFYEFTPK